MKLTATFYPQSVDVSVTPASMGVGFNPPIAKEYVERDPYEGSYNITPSADTQIIPTDGLRMTADLVVNPIPSNYGLITWNGSTLTVS